MVPMEIFGETGLLGRAFRFVGAGLANTGLTLLVYQGSLFIVGHQVAYAVAWISGLIFVVSVYPNRVFGKRNPTVRSLIVLAFFYGGVFLLGSMALQLLTGSGIAPRLSVFFVLVITSMANFAVGRRIFK